MDILCQRCHQPVASFKDWFASSCALETPSNYGHRLDWPSIMRLPAGSPHQEMRQTLAQALALLEVKQ